MILDLNEKQENFVNMYCQGETITAISKEIGVSRKTLYSWLEKDNVKKAIRNKKKQLKAQLDDKLLEKANSIVQGLVDIALNGESEQNRLKAQMYVLNKLTGMPTSKTVIETDEEKTDNDLSWDNLNNISEFKLVK